MKRTKAVLVGMLLVFFVIGCGGGKSEDKGDDGGATQTSSETDDTKTETPITTPIDNGKTLAKLPDTGQTTSYTNTFGEDSDYTINPPSYTDNGDGTVTDNVTELMWQKEDDDIRRNWTDAGTYCDSLSLGGFSDWRLPSVIELESLTDSEIISPTINSTYFPNTTSSPYWSSTSSAPRSSEAWIVYSYHGSVYDLSKSMKSFSPYVRCVRAGAGNSIAKNFTANNSTVTDNDTRLVWQQTEGGSMTWEEALVYCEGLSLGGSTDWRLPNKRELTSLMDTSRYDPALDKAFFPQVNSSFYWSSTTDASSNTLFAWIGYFKDGGVPSNNKLFSNYVRCVRGGQ